MLLRTRLLIQANSGGGKSFTCRRLAEQFFGKIPVIIVDPEGEFATLRERFGYVLVGKGGETPADPRSASLVAHKLLELRASAVCDLYELKPLERHRWVKLFLEALIDAPKKFWRPTIIIVDEAHTFCPEKGAGESEASEAMTSLPTRGRKRRFCAVWATQRLGKLRKDASAELLNRLVGPTFEDVDLKRAADLLSILPEGRRDFDQQMRVLEPGHFFAIGRAICKERLMLKIGGVQTSHELENSKYALEPPPPPDKVRLLLPKLADLPKAAEEKARTEAEMRQEIRALKGELALTRKAAPVISKPIVDNRDLERAVREERQRWQRPVNEMSKLLGRVAATLRKLVEEVQVLPALPVHHVDPVPQPRIEPVKRAAAILAPKSLDETAPDNELTGPEQRILNAIVWLESIGNDSPEQTAVAFLAGYRYGCGGFNNPRGALRVKGMVEYVGNKIRLTPHGRNFAQAPATPLTTAELHKAVLGRLPGPEQRLLMPLLEAGVDGLTNAELAERANYTLGSGGYNNPRGRLRSLGLVEYRGDRVVARHILFLD